MTEWVYKSRRARATYADAHNLAVVDHFLCISAFTHCGGPERVRLVEKVAEPAIDDVIHFYYRTDLGLVRSFGSFRVCDGSAFPDVFSACPGLGSLVRVNEACENRAMLARLTRGYSHDPKLAAFTGWALDKLPVDSGTPGFNQAKMFPTLGTSLWQYPDPTLSHRASA